MSLNRLFGHFCNNQDQISANKHDDLKQEKFVSLGLVGLWGLYDPFLLSQDKDEGDVSKEQVNLSECIKDELLDPVDFVPNIPFGLTGRK